MEEPSPITSYLSCLRYFIFLYIPHVFFSLFRQKGFRERQLHVSITYSKYCVINHIVTLWSFGYPGFNSYLQYVFIVQHCCLCNTVLAIFVLLLSGKARYIHSWVYHFISQKQVRWLWWATVQYITWWHLMHFYRRSLKYLG